MNLASRIFLAAYTAAVSAVVIGLYSLHSDDTLWPVTGLTALAYLFLAIGYTTSRNADGAPTRVWIALTFLATCLLPSPMLIAFFEERPLVMDHLRTLAIMTFGVLAALALSFLMLRDIRSTEPRLRLRRILIPIGLFSGAACVFSTLGLRVTDADQAGWKVVRGEIPWITAHISVATGLFTGNELKYLQPFYQHGRIIYILSLLATVAILIRFAAARFSLNRLRDSSLLTVPAVIACLTSFWVLTDIYWGWHFDLNGAPWAAAIATALWLSGPIFAAVLLIPILWKPRETWRLHAFLLLQLPIAGFNCMQLQAYFGPGSLNLEGLGTLIIGLQLETCACLDLLAHRGKNELELFRAKNAALDYRVEEEVTVGKAS